MNPAVPNKYPIIADAQPKSYDASHELDDKPCGFAFMVEETSCEPTKASVIPIARTTRPAVNVRLFMIIRQAFIFLSCWFFDASAKLQMRIKKEAKAEQPAKIVLERLVKVFESVSMSELKLVSGLLWVLMMVWGWLLELVWA